MHHVIEAVSATAVAIALAAALVMLPRPKPEIPPEQKPPVEVPLRPSINDAQPAGENKQVVPESQDDKVADIEARLKEIQARVKRIDAKVDERAKK